MWNFCKNLNIFFYSKKRNACLQVFMTSFCLWFSHQLGTSQVSPKVHRSLQEALEHSMAMMSDSHNALADVSGHSRIHDVHSAVLPPKFCVSEDFPPPRSAGKKTQRSFFLWRKWHDDFVIHGTSIWRSDWGAYDRPPVLRLYFITWQHDITLHQSQSTTLQRLESI